MSYQPPGPYPVFPQQSSGLNTPPKPPIPQTVQRAFALMLVGAGLEVVNAGLSFAFESQVSDKINQAIDSGQQVTNNSAGLGSGAVGAIIGLGLWIWMAVANRSGHNWARVTGTVFFGISCLGLLADVVVFGLIAKWLGGVVVILIAEAAASWLVGLLAVILLWRKQSSAYFQPPMMPVYYPGYGVPPGVMPDPMMQNGGPQPPADPWATPGGQG